MKTVWKVFYRKDDIWHPATNSLCSANRRAAEDLCKKQGTVYMAEDGRVKYKDLMETHIVKVSFVPNTHGRLDGVAHDFITSTHKTLPHHTSFV